MTEDNAYDQLNDVFREMFAQDDIVLGPTTTASDIEGWDSFTNLSLMVAVEARFGIRIRTGEIEQLHNVGDLVGLILARSPL